jgi:hypothetical protein
MDVTLATQEGISIHVVNSDDKWDVTIYNPATSATEEFCGLTEREFDEMIAGYELASIVRLIRQ